MEDELPSIASLEDVEEFGKALGEHARLFSSHIHYRKFALEVIDALTNGMNREQLKEVSDDVVNIVEEYTPLERAVDDPSDFADFM
jgi:hypothetical protein